MVTTDPDTGPVERSRLVKGYAVEKNNYVLFTDEEIKAVKLETTKTLEIERFVDADTIDRLYWDSPYILAPQDDASAEAYGVIQEAMRRTNRIGLGRVVMHGRERLMAIEARDAGLLATSLRMRDEVRSTSAALTMVPGGKHDKQMISIAEQIIAQKEGPFEPDQFNDRYEDALRALIEEKKRGHKIIQSKEPENDGNVVDLMEALRKSLQGRSSRAKPKASATVSPIKRKRQS